MKWLPVAVVAVGYLFVSCTRDGSVTTAPDEGRFDWRTFSGTSINVIVNDHPWLNLIEPKLPEFRDLTGIDVTLHPFPEDQFRTKRTVEFVSGVSQYDAFMIMPGNSLNYYARRGWTEPLDRFLEDKRLLWPDFAVDDFYVSALEAGKYGGVHMVIPLLLETSIIAYNRDILDRYGLEPPATMQDLERVARAVMEESGGDVYGITMRGNAVAATSQWSGFLHSFGGGWTDGRGNAALDSPEAIAALEFYGDLLRRYGPRDATRNSWYESVSLFSDGRAAMIYDANVFRRSYEDPEQSRIHDSVGYAMIPAGPAGRIPHFSHWGLSIYSGSDNKEAAWLFLQWATSRANTGEAHEAGIPSARVSVWQHPAELDNVNARQWTQVSIESYEVGTPNWNPPVIDVDSAREIVGRAIIASILGNDVERAARAATEELNRLIERERE